MTKKEKDFLIGDSITIAVNDIEDALVENKIETIVAFNVGAILGELQTKVDALLKMEVTDDN